MGPLGPSLPFEKFLVVVGGGWVVVVVETNFSVQLSPKLNNIAELEEILKEVEELS